MENVMDPVDILMEGTLYGAQVDSALMEAKGNKSPARKRNRGKLLDDSALAELKQRLKFKETQKEIKSPLESEPVIKDGANKEEISKVVNTKVTKVNKTVGAILTEKVNEIDEIEKTLIKRAKENQINFDKIKANPEASEQSFKEIQDVIEQDKKDSKFIKARKAVFLKVKNALKVVLKKITPLYNALTLRSIATKGGIRVAMQAAGVAVIYSIIFGIAKTMSEIKLGSLASVVGNIKALLNASDVLLKTVKGWVIYLLLSLIAFTVGDVAVTLVKTIIDMIKNKMGTEK